MAGDPDPVGDAESDSATHVNIALPEDPVEVSILISEDPVEEETPAPAEAAPVVSNMSKVTTRKLCLASNISLHRRQIVIDSNLVSTKVSGSVDVFKAAVDGDAGAMRVLKIEQPEKLKAKDKVRWCHLP